ncbi:MULTISPECIES: DUF1194 domain-containing protein [Rhodomicrobium]|uniref:DUF1194 domain-containing protein n=1 Tax=Rhodomicrobium TaxID=1068 RepID=UPI000B4B2EB2|nr:MULTISPECIES: DUF1194 domain-containing protein [Rhodomicrobium]
MLLRVLLSLCLSAMAAAATPAGAEDVDIELVFLADSSGSIDSAETAFQRQGHAEALNHPDVLRAIRQGPLQRIAVTYVEWGDARHQDVVVPWMLIDGPESAKAFAAALAAAPKRAFGYNAIGSALARGRELIQGNSFRGARLVMDLSGDSANSWDGISIREARDTAVAAGIVINGLPILCREPDCGGRPVGYDLERAFEEQIIGGPGAFVVTAKDRESFELAVRRKLILEIAGLTPSGKTRLGFAPGPAEPVSLR